MCLPISLKKWVGKQEKDLILIRSFLFAMTMAMKMVWVPSRSGPPHFPNFTSFYQFYLILTISSGSTNLVYSSAYPSPPIFPAHMPLNTSSTNRRTSPIPLPTRQHHSLLYHIFRVVSSPLHIFLNIENRASTPCLFTFPYYAPTL
jgi:hypothetical protein